MRTELQKVINLKNFFKIIGSSSSQVTYNFKKPSKVLFNNIYINWLKAISTKSTKHFPVLINKNMEDLKKKALPFGAICHCITDEHDIGVQHCLSQFAPEKKTNLHLKLYIPKQDAMQYFIQWQRLRKYWWSSITTTPSLFSINEMKYVNDMTEVDIVAQFPWGQEVVETVTLNTQITDVKNALCISCSTTLEGALFILLLDGQNKPSESHLRLHRKMAPYKISFALDYKDTDNKETLNELAILLYNILEGEKISTWLPDFALSMESQIKENLLMGVAYTAVISEGTLSNGIMHLLNSNTTLKEQIHIADLSSYAALLFQK
ncbi:DNA polymerase subunit gamma-2, mitochondrial [Cydia strobilella]|uniref:DNA polymerase subunit gamma-2, mitochondrial n=1 Tax=Cydia strobilella TaxID=1100964 RepID=UPI003007B2C0